jgi:hypothetical protein
VENIYLKISYLHTDLLKILYKQEINKIQLAGCLNAVMIFWFWPHGGFFPECGGGLDPSVDACLR